MNAAKSIKSAAKEAKQRLKSRFWEDYRKEVEIGVKKAESDGIGTGCVENYFRKLAVRTINKPAEDEEGFYVDVKTCSTRKGRARPTLWTDLWTKNSFIRSITFSAKGICSFFRKNISNASPATTKSAA